MEQRLSMVTLGVESIERAKMFYEQGLGFFAHTSSQEGITFYQLNGLVLGLFPKVELDKDMQVESVGKIGHTTLAYNTRSKEEVDSVFDEAITAGATALKQPQEVFWGGYSGYFLDPDNHVWEVAYNPFWQIDVDGNIQLGAAG